MSLQQWFGTRQRSSLPIRSHRRHNHDQWATSYKHALQRPGYMRVTAQKIRTAEELERMTPAEQDAIFGASIVRNLDDVPEEFLARVLARFEAHLAGSESPAQ